MNLQTLRQSLLTNIYDDRQEAFDTARCNLFINQAMMHVANIADRQDQAIFVRPTAVVKVSTGEFVEVPFYTGTPNWGITTLTRPRRILRVYRDGLAGKSHELKVVPFEDRYKFLPDAATDTPVAFVREQTVGFCRPVDQTDYHFDFVFSLPFMQTDTDTPGQAAGAGTADLLPAEYHPIIATYATVLALAAERRSTAEWRDLYAEQRDELLATFAGRRGKIG